MKEDLKFIIDTDIGDDIDDAFALYLALRLNYDIVGITTVFQNTEKRARIVKKILKTFGRGYENVPVLSGYGKTFNGEENETEHLIQYSEELDDEKYAPDDNNPENAVDFLINSCEKYGENLVILAIGPFTNIAKAVQKSPSSFDKINKVVIMGGAFFKQYADWNVFCDVQAAKIMFENCKNLECLGADVTHLLKLNFENSKIISEYLGKSATAEYVKELYRKWQDYTKTFAWLHDPLVIYYATHPEVCEMKEQSIIVITDGVAKGMTLNVDAYGKSYLNKKSYENIDLSHKIKVAYSVNKEEILDAFFQLFEI